MASRAKKKKQSREGSLQTCGTFPFKGNDPNKLLEFVNQAQQITTQTQIDFQGPLPPPELMREYNQIIPGSAERLLLLVEMEQNHRHECEKYTLKALEQDAKKLRMGEWREDIISFLVFLCSMGLGLYCIFNGNYYLAGLTVGAPIITAASNFCIRNYKKSKIKNEEQEKTNDNS